MIHKASLRTFLGFGALLVLLGMLVFVEKRKADLPTKECPVVLYLQPEIIPLEVPLCLGIEQAVKSLEFSSYSFDHTKMAQLLTEAQGRGLEVYGVTDSLAHTLPTSFPIDRRHPSHGLMHSKILIVDRKQVWFGSCNFTNSGLTTQANLLIGVEDPTLAAPLAAYLHQPTPMSWKRSYLEADIRIQTLPKAGMLSWVKEILSYARKSCYLAQYQLTHPELIEALIHLHDRGVDVAVVLDRSAIGTGRSQLQRLLDAGIRLYLWEGMDVMHHKFAWIDHENLICGSTNWTKGGLRRNTEILAQVLWKQPVFKEAMDRHWKRLKNRSRLLEQLPRKHRVLNVLATSSHIIDDGAQTDLIDQSDSSR